MAKKASAKKGVKKQAAKKTGKKGGSKKAARKPSPKKAGASLKPKKVTTGKGPSPAELGKALVEHCRSNGDDAALWKKHFSRNFTSTEGMGMRWEGVKAVTAKNAEWMATHKIHGGSVEGPFVGATGFAVRFAMDVEDLTNGHRMQFTEVGVYTVKGGKIVSEEFMYGG